MPTKDAPGIPLVDDPLPIYFNGFGYSIGAGDVVVTLLRNGKPTVTLNASFTVMKSFVESLSVAIVGAEEAAGHRILTIDNWKDAFEKSNPPENG